MSNKRKAQTKITYARGRRAMNTYGLRVIRRAARAFDRPVADFESHAAYMQWYSALPRNVRAVMMVWTVEECMAADARMLANAY